LISSDSSRSALTAQACAPFLNARRESEQCLSAFCVVVRINWPRAAVLFSSARQAANTLCNCWVIWLRSVKIVSKVAASRAASQTRLIPELLIRPSGLRLSTLLTGAPSCVEIANSELFGSQADMCATTGHVRFTPNSDRESGPSRQAMSALPLRADMCSAIAHVGYGPKADIALRSQLAFPCRRCGSLPTPYPSSRLSVRLRDCLF
jgi:hypothetical protein